MPKNSKIYIASDIGVDRDYINVTDDNMLTVVQNHMIASANNYSFIRRNRSLKVNFTYAQCVQCNYMAFQNPDYSNKWFFAWIDNIEYVGENTVEIEFTIDQWSTWYSSLVKQSVFVEREHVNSDAYGTHTLPEPVKPDHMISQGVVQRYYDSFYLAVYWLPTQISSQNYNLYALDDRYFSPVNIYIYPASSAGVLVLQSDLITGGALANTNILAINLIPAAFLDDTTSKEYSGRHNTVTQANNMPRPANLNGYVPVNNKCLIYPYTYLTVNNGNTEKVYRYEKFTNIAQGAAVNIVGGPVPNGAVAIYPFNYDGISGANVAESLTLGDLPMLPFAIDSYAAWLAQKSSSTVMQGIMSTLTGALAGGLKAGPMGAAIGGAGGAIGGIVNYMIQNESARNENDRVIGTSNIDIDMIKGMMGFTLAQKCCVADDAERIDRFFSQYGYNISMTKEPNYTGRDYWNYVKINGSAGYGSMPEEARNTINRILNKGTTIWHSHSYLGNYFVGGQKMQNPITQV